MMQYCCCLYLKVSTKQYFNFCWIALVPVRRLNVINLSMLSKVFIFCMLVFSFAGRALEQKHGLDRTDGKVPDVPFEAEMFLYLRS